MLVLLNLLDSLPAFSFFKITPFHKRLGAYANELMTAIIWWLQLDSLIPLIEVKFKFEWKPFHSFSFIGFFIGSYQTKNRQTLFIQKQLFL